MRGRQKDESKKNRIYAEGGYHSDEDEVCDRRVMYL
jgi:hypothetical protein